MDTKAILIAAAAVLGILVLAVLVWMSRGHPRQRRLAGGGRRDNVRPFAA